MTSSVQTELHAYAWDEGEQPVEVLLPEGAAEVTRPQYPGDNALERELMNRLDTKEYGKFVRTYPVSLHVDGSELALWYRAGTDEYRGRWVVSGLDEAERDAAYEAHKVFCAQKVFSPAELYALKPTRVDFGSWHTVNVHFQNDVNYYEIDLDAVEKTQRMETRTIIDYDYDGRRGWTLQTIWFDKKPVMVVNSSGRDGDEYHDRWITDAGLFGELIAFLRSFIPEAEVAGYAKASDKIPAMTEFYGHTIHDYYDVERQESRKS
jgi:hypothetical protein